MKAHRMRIICIWGALSSALILGTVAQGATSFTNSLTGFTGHSTQPATQAAVAAAGFSFFSTEGLDDEFTMDPTIVFGPTGANFGSLYGGDNGRNYMRTNDSDYATVDFTAEVTVERTANAQQVFIGLGAGDTALFGVPDWSTLFSSTFVTPEDTGLTTWRTANDGNEFIDGPPMTAAGIHRVRMEFDSVARTMVYSIDLGYDGVAFLADVTAPTTDLNHIDCPTGCGFPEMPISADFFAADGWPSEPSRIFFGGDDGSLFRDFSVTVSAPPGLPGDFNEDNKVNAADYVVWRKTDGSPENFNLWKANFGAMAGSGSAVNVSGIPEPTSLPLMILGSLTWSVIMSRRRLISMQRISYSPRLARV